MEEIRTVGRFGLAVAIWAAIIWIVMSPKRLLITGASAFIFIFVIALLNDDTGDIHYVNVHKLELLDAPYGNPSRTLLMNDTLRLVRNMSDDWTAVSVGIDTMYFQGSYERNFEDLGYSWSKIQKTPFTAMKGLNNQEIIINHPDGYIEIGSKMLKNGEKHRVVSVPSWKSNKVTIHIGQRVDIDIEHIIADWETIERKFPRRN